jgi:hypothetical protein
MTRQFAATPELATFGDAISIDDLAKSAGMAKQKSSDPRRANFAE